MRNLTCYIAFLPHGESKGEEERQESSNRRVGHKFLVVFPCTLKPSTHDYNTKPRCVSLAPELIRMIFQFADKATLRACSQAAREFRHDALCCLGRHLTVNTFDRVKECAQLVAQGAFQHIRSLDLGINSGELILKGDWRYYDIILAAFAGYRTLNRLWFSEVPFDLIQSNQKRHLRKTITALGSTVTELGLYECCFSSYEEMISLIRSFPLCDSLFLVGCVTRGGLAVGNAFAGLPVHQLRIKDLQLSASSFRRTTLSRITKPYRSTPRSDNTVLIDVSKLIEDAALDVGSLTALVCDVRNSERTGRIAAAVSGSPVEQFQVACRKPGGFQGGRSPFGSKR